MRRVATLFVIAFALLAFAPAVAADTTEPGGNYRDSYESIGFDAWSSECGARTCTDTYIWASQDTTQSGETYTIVCVDQWTYNIRNGSGSGAGGCTESANIMVADDLSSASLAATEISICDERNCETVTVSAELQGTGETSTFRGKFTEKDGTCTFTYSDSGKRQYATGTITLDGDTLAAEGSIRSSTTTFASRCR